MDGQELLNFNDQLLRTRFQSIRHDPHGHHRTKVLQTFIIGLVCEGIGPKQIASLLQISENEIGRKITTFKKRIGIYDWPTITKWAIREGVTGVE